MKIKKAKLPEDSAVIKYLPVNFTEVLAANVAGNLMLNPDDLQVGFWTDMPGWITFLFKLRNILVKPFGLSGGDGNMAMFEEAIRNGASYSLMRVSDKTDKETVLCLDDKHLQAYLSVYVEQPEQNNQQKIVVTTLVRFHKRLGRFYFYSIYPFHCIIVKRQIKRIIRKRIKIND
ncbi:MAG: DUF2867 domain-containing protein [Prevotellaceae bacterium]|jgi:hypothetical protein|nr:DUF2867 domain-containing protein [Prevotellaceae bacterium]